MVPWDCQKLMLKQIHMSFICQNFSSNGPTGKKFDVFPSTAFKRTALQPLKVVKPFFDTLEERSVVTCSSYPVDFSILYMGFPNYRLLGEAQLQDTTDSSRVNSDRLVVRSFDDFYDIGKKNHRILLTQFE